MAIQLFVHMEHRRKRRYSCSGFLLAGGVFYMLDKVHVMQAVDVRVILYDNLFCEIF